MKEGACIKILISAVFVLIFSLIVLGSVSAANSPDLTVTKITSFNNTDKGQKIIVDYTIKNQGTLSTKKSFYTNFYLVKSKSLSGKKIYLGSQLSTTLNSKKSITKKTKLTIPKKVDYGTYYVAGFVDSKKKIKEGKESNNIQYTKKKLSVYPKIDSSTKKGTPPPGLKTYEIHHWKTYKYSSKYLYIDGYITDNKNKYLYYVNYKIQKVSQNKIKVSMYTPWAKYMYGYSPVVSYIYTLISPVKVYTNLIKPNLRKIGFADPEYLLSW